MRLIVVNHEYPPLGGGAATACESLVGVLAQRGHELLVVTSAAPGYPTREELPHRSIVRLSDGRRSVLAPRPGELLRFCLQLRRRLPDLVETFRPDGILAFFAVPAGGLATSAARRYGIPCVVSLRGSDVPGFPSQRLAGWQRVALRPWIRRTLLRADAVAPNNEYLCELAVRFEPRISARTVILPNGVEPSLLAPGPACSGTAELRLVTVAQFIPRKRLDLGIETIRGLAESGVAGRLTLVGGGPLEPVLRRHVHRAGMAERVEFAGLRPRAEVAQLLRRHDVFLFTSQAEGASNAMLEAMAAGLPIVTTRNGAETLVLEAGCGVVVDSAEPAALTAAVRELGINSAMRRQFAEAGLRYARSHPWERSAEQLEALFGRLLGMRRRQAP